MFTWEDLHMIGRDITPVTMTTAPQSHGSPAAIAHAFGAKLAREHPKDWPRLLGIAVQAAMEAERIALAARGDGV